MDSQLERPETSQKASGAFKYLQPYTQSKGPALLLSTLFGASAFVPQPFLPRKAYFPPFLHRAGFSLALGGAAYVLSTGDTRNGSGIATAWSLTYLFLHARRSLRPPPSLHPLTLALTAGSAACAGLYGTQYFVYEV
ncbi:hypothetical protein BJ138DRAFT_1160809 [Hygrophoropsis aurantiaca]|uniref:Uncharacterized protein n=1 Tax=Hygrophoropsis aurantiaca TaxID=72124 RepID=A0ACB8A1Z1_9AGAM|nr:hypothetical protein BJ138DRAFT_1160809 [Hygrophoropsis aurantiaca]